MDPYLVALARAAEAGQPCPAIWLTASGGELVTGKPTRSRDFIEHTYDTLLHHRHRVKGIRKKEPEEGKEPETLATADIAPINVEVDSAAEPDSITLLNARVFYGGRADGVDLRTVRIRLSAITLWWIAGGKPFKPPSGFIFGAVVPIDGG